MANVDAPKGCWPIRHLCGGQIRANSYTVTTGETIYQGDVVELDAAGTVGVAEAGDATAVIGVAAEYIDDSGSAGGKKILIYDDPNIVFGIQQQTGGTVAADDVGLSADHVAGSGSTTTKLSGHELSSTVAVTAAQFLILGKISESNNGFGEHCDLEVIFNEHRYKGAGSAGV